MAPYMAYIRIRHGVSRSTSRRRRQSHYHLPDTRNVLVQRVGSGEGAVQRVFRVDRDPEFRDHSSAGKVSGNSGCFFPKTQKPWETPGKNYLSSVNHPKKLGNKMK